MKYKDQLSIALQLLTVPVRSWAWIMVLGSLTLAGIDMLGVAALLPLMQLVTGSSTESGILGWISRFLGTTDRPSLIIAVAIGVAFIFIFKSIFNVAFRWWMLGKTSYMEVDASTEMMRRFLAEPYAIHRTRQLSEVVRAMNSAVSQTFGQNVLGLLSLITDLLTALMIVLVLVFVSPVTATVVIVFFACVVLGTQMLLGKRHTRIGERLAESDVEAWVAMMPALHGFRETRMLGKASIFVDRFAQSKVKRAEASRQLSLVSELPRYVLEVAFVIAVGLMSLLLFTLYQPNDAIAILAVFSGAATRLLPSLNRIGATLGILRSSKVGLGILVDEIEKLREQSSHIDVPNGQFDFRGDISVRDVEFGFSDSDSPVIEKVSTTIASGQTVAFVGSSGAGKSTLLDIILGLLEPDAGSVSVGGNDIKGDIAGWQRLIGVVPQDVYLLDDTLAANIAFGESPNDIDQERLHQAIELAQLDSLLETLPNGLETTLGERGVRLSGGQRQRVGIARALYRKPQLLVLDEATSALDNLTEKKITETIDGLRGRMTIIVVAHRLSTIRNADKVVFMSGGQIEVEGSFREVEKESREFAQLVALGKLG